VPKKHELMLGYLS